MFPNVIFSGSWERRSSPRSWSWSNSRGSTGCVRVPASGKSAVAGGKVRNGVLTCAHTHKHTHVWTCIHAQILTGQISAPFKKGDLQFPLSPLLCVLYPSSLRPHSSPYSLCVMKTPKEKQYHRVFEALDCCGAAVHTNLSGSVSLRGRDIQRHDFLSYPNTHRNAVHTSLCLETHKQAVFPLLLLLLIHGMQRNAKMHEGKSRVKHTLIRTCWDKMCVKCLEKRIERMTKELTVVTSGSTVWRRNGNDKAAHILLRHNTQSDNLCIHCECWRQREPILAPNASNTVTWSVARHIYTWCCSYTPSIWCSGVKSEKSRGDGWLVDGSNAGLESGLASHVWLSVKIDFFFKLTQVTLVTWLNIVILTPSMIFLPVVLVPEPNQIAKKSQRQ